MTAYLHFVPANCDAICQQCGHQIARNSCTMFVRPAGELIPQRQLCYACGIKLLETQETEATPA